MLAKPGSSPPWHHNPCTVQMNSPEPLVRSPYHTPSIPQGGCPPIQQGGQPKRNHLPPWWIPVLCQRPAPADCAADCGGLRRNIRWQKLLPNLPRSNCGGGGDLVSTGQALYHLPAMQETTGWNIGASCPRFERHNRARTRHRQLKPKPESHPKLTLVCVAQLLLVGQREHTIQETKRHQ